MDSIDKKVITELNNIMGDDYVSVYDAFLRSANEGVPELENAVSTGDNEKIESIAHSLKGSSSNVGAKKLSQFCAAMLENLRKGAFDKTHADFESIQTEFQKVVKEINENILK